MQSGVISFTLNTSTSAQAQQALFQSVVLAVLVLELLDPAEKLRSAGWVSKNGNSRGGRTSAVLAALKATGVWSESKMGSLADSNRLRCPTVQKGRWKVPKLWEMVTGLPITGFQTLMTLLGPSTQALPLSDSYP